MGVFPGAVCICEERCKSKPPVSHDSGMFAVLIQFRCFFSHRWMIMTARNANVRLIFILCIDSGAWFNLGKNKWKHPGYYPSFEIYCGQLIHRQLCEYKKFAV